MEGDGLRWERRKGRCSRRCRQGGRRGVEDKADQVERQRAAIAEQSGFGESVSIPSNAGPPPPGTDRHQQNMIRTWNVPTRALRLAETCEEIAVGGPRLRSRLEAPDVLAHAVDQADRRARPTPGGLPGLRIDLQVILRLPFKYFLGISSSA